MQVIQFCFPWHPIIKYKCLNLAEQTFLCVSVSGKNRKTLGVLHPDCFPKFSPKHRAGYLTAHLSLWGNIIITFFYYCIFFVCQCCDFNKRKTSVTFLNNLWRRMEESLFRWCLIEQASSLYIGIKSIILLVK